ncbi:sugar-binding transcriptional regulator [Enterococcus sp. 669A]|uniref:Sugar-binding transcriptional regulator n=1 Tax=Candidatus Enterococcus moelleringii TaxID=2815325 RepID=A0ABS3LEQ4_9ENTE|nr:sugar-binding transcriptional regulator [Enterococcus sp. 669A]MBO1308126.1 sugar-binding transcriptional regulator [Enterococcus sp. 669A]
MKEEKKKLLAKVAYMYYQQDLTQAQIAKELDIYRTTVSRMLAQAKEAGIVEITINHFDPALFSLEDQLKKAYNLKHIEIAPLSNDLSAEEKEEQLARTAASWLRRQLNDDSVIGVSWGESVGKAVNQLETKSLDNATIVPIVGGPSHINSRYHVNTLVYELARKLNGHSVFVNATVTQETKQLAEGIFQSKYFQELRDYWQQLDLAIVGIGGPLSYKKSQWRDLLTEEDFQELKLREAIGDCCCRFYDRHGKLLKGQLDQRTIGLPLEALAEIPQSIGIARGTAKARSIVPLLKEGYLNTLITDQETAAELLRITNELQQ